MRTAAHPSGAASQGDQPLADFILSFSQALLRAGYYQPGHPQAQRATESLYQRFHRLFRGHGELTILLQDLGASSIVLVEGALAGPQRLGDLLPADMAAAYAPRLAHFLERSRLVSLTLKEDVAEDEFSRFIDVMSESVAGELDAASRERLQARLREGGVTRCSLVFREDLVAVERKLPWRAHVAIARLKKDLSQLPQSHDLDLDGLRAQRRQVLHDVLRPLPRPDLLAAVLMNSDLVAAREAIEEVEDDLVRFIPEPLVLPTARTALQLYPPDADAAVAPRHKRALLKLLLLPRPSELHGVVDLLREMFDQGEVTLEQLPAGLKAQVMVERDTARFLSQRAAVLGQLEQTTGAGEYQQQVAALLRFVPELVRRNLLDEVLVLATTLGGHAALGGERAHVAADALAQLATGELGAALKERFVHGKKEDRIALGPVYQVLGERGRLQLVGILEESRDAWVRKNASEILLRMGAGGVDAALAELASGHLPPEGIAELLMVFGELRTDEPKVREVLHHHARHRDPRVREEAAWALCRIAGAAEERLFLHLLEDHSVEVRRRALRCLRAARCAAGLARVVGLLANVEGNSTLEAIEPQLYAALPDLAEASGSRGGPAETFLIEKLKASVPGGLLGSIRRPRRPLNDEALFAVCDALGTVGTAPAREALADAIRHAKEPGRERLERALKRIEARAT